MANDDGLTGTEWERHKFSVEMELRERGLRLSENRLKADTRRIILISALVPIVVTLMTAVPTYLNSLNQQALQEAAFEAQSITESIRTGDPNQAAVLASFSEQRGSLPSTSNILSFAPAQQIAIQRLATTYCGEVANNASVNSLAFCRKSSCSSSV